MSLRDEIAEILCDDPDDPDTVRDAYNRADAVLALLSEGKWHDEAAERMEGTLRSWGMAAAVAHEAAPYALLAAVGGET